MKKLVLYLMLLMAVPATAQSGLFGSHSHHHHASIYNTHHDPYGPMFKEIPNYGPAHHHEAPGMNPRDFEDAVRFISEENFDEKRLGKAKRIIIDNPMSTRQIATICKLFTFEANRLEFAKFAYHHCVDSNIYFLIDEVFTFESSKDELDKYIHRW